MVLQHFFNRNKLLPLGSDKMFSCEFSEVFKNILFKRTPQEAVSVVFMFDFWDKQTQIRNLEIKI